MASFTDQISQFNPYIQELPVEAMAQVGMAKQAQYDQGVQKVQNYVDRVAGLEIAKPQHKQYLQSKMDELGNRLKIVAAGDFSNQQLVNSVSGMTGQIIKDPIVQNAVYSTQVLKKGESDREIAVKAGKTSPANDDLWNDTKSAWFNNADLNTPFDGKFIERWDVDKKLKERAEMILKNPDTLTQEQPYKHDGKGNTLYYGTEPVKDKEGKVVIDPKTKQPVLRQTESLDPSKGLPQYDEAMLRISVKGVSPEKLYNNFLDSLDSKDAQQLRIDARYKYKNATAESFAPDIAKLYGEKKAFQSQEIVNLTGALTEPDLTAEQKAAITARITDLQQQEKDGVIDKEFLSTMEALKDPRNLEKYKEEIYTQQHLMNMAKDMSFKSYEQEIKSNPYMQMFMQKQNYNLDVQKFNDSSRREWAGYDLRVRAQNFTEFSSNRDYKYKVDKDKLENPDPVITTTVVPTNVTPKTVDDQWKVASDAANLMKGLKNKYAARLFPGLTPAQQKEAFSNLFAKYDTNPTGNYSPDEMEFLDQYRRADRDMMAASKLGSAAQKIKDEEDAKVYKNIAGAGGYSGEDIGKVAKIMGQFKPRQITETFQYFQNYEGGKYMPLYKAYYGDVTVPKQSEIKKAIDNAKTYVAKSTSQADEKVSQYLADHTPKKFTQDMALDMSNSKTISAVNKYLTSAAIDQNAIGAGDASTVLEWMTGEDGSKIKAVVRKLDDGTTQTVFIKPDGSKTVTLPMNVDQRGFFPEVKKSSPYGYLKNYIEISPNKTSDIMDKRSPQVDPVNAVNAPLTGTELPGFMGSPDIAPLVRFTVEGNHDNNGSSQDTYLLNMFIKDPKSSIWKAGRVTPQYIKWGGIENILNNAGRDAYFEGLKTWK
jgi:hypothetical protein